MAVWTVNTLHKWLVNITMLIKVCCTEMTILIHSCFALFAHLAHLEIQNWEDIILCPCPCHIYRTLLQSSIPVSPPPLIYPAEEQAWTTEHLGTSDANLEQKNLPKANEVPNVFQSNSPNTLQFIAKYGQPVSWKLTNPTFPVHKLTVLVIFLDCFQCIITDNLWQS